MTDLKQPALNLSRETRHVKTTHQNRVKMEKKDSEVGSIFGWVVRVSGLRPGVAWLGVWLTLASGSRRHTRVWSSPPSPEGCTPGWWAGPGWAEEVGLRYARWHSQWPCWWPAGWEAWNAPWTGEKLWPAHTLKISISTRWRRLQGAPNFKGLSAPCTLNPTEVLKPGFQTFPLPDVKFRLPYRNL